MQNTEKSVIYNADLLYLNERRILTILSICSIIIKHVVYLSIGRKSPENDTDPACGRRDEFINRNILLRFPTEGRGALIRRLQWQR